MATLIDSEYILETFRDFIKANEGDESTEKLLINLACQILDVSADKLIEEL